MPDSGMPGGMPIWWVTEPLLNVWIADTPVSYQPGRGPQIAFTLLLKNEMSQTEHNESKTSSHFSVGLNWNTPWRSYVVSLGSSAYDFYNGLGGRITLTNNGGASFRGQMTLTLSNSTPIVQYPDGARDVFDYYHQDGLAITRFYLTAHVDPFGNITSFDYDLSSAVCLTNITDVDSRHTTFTYTNINGFSMIATVTDPFSRTASLAYDHPTNSSMPHLTNITDAVGMSSSLQYDDEGNISKLITPYATNSFVGMASADITANKALWVQEQGVHSGLRNHLYLYSDLGNTNLMTNSLAAWRPSTTNGGEFSFANTFDAADSHTHNSFYWGPQQYSLLPTDFVNDLVNSRLYLSELQATNILHARMKHWLIRTIGSSNVVCTTLSLERNPSPDGITPGQITWYDYANKTGGDPKKEGTSMLPLFVAQKLPNGEARFTYALRNSAGHPTSVIGTWNDTAGNLKVRTNILTYAGNNVDLITITNALGILVSSNVYNPDHLLTTNYDALGQRTVFTYDNNHRVTSVTIPTGLVTTNIYGGDGYLSRTVDIGFRTNSFTYANALVNLHTNELGLVTSKTWDALNRLIKVTYPDATYVTNIYSNLDLVKTIDRMGFTNRYNYNDFRQVVHSIDALDRTNTYSYCDCGELTSIMDPLSHVTLLYYDLSGRQTMVSFADGYWVSNRIDLIGRITNIVNSGGITVTNYFNNQGDKYAASNFFGQLVKLSFDILDRMTNSVDANGVGISMTYDNLNRPKTRTFPDAGVERFGYSARGLIAYTNQLDKVTNYEYDESGRKTAETNANAEVTRFTYDAAGNLLAITDGANHTTTWSHDIYGLATNKTEHTGTEIFRYGYDANRRLTSRWSAAKGNTSYAYDKVGNLTNVIYPVSSAISIAYDKLNRLTNMIDAVGVTCYVYDPAGLLSSEDGPWISDNVSYTHNNRQRNDLSLDQPGASAWEQTYSYDGARRLTNSTSPAGSFNYAYDEMRQRHLKKVTLPNMAYITNTYDNVSRLLSTALKNTNNAILNMHSYSYNVGNQRTDQVFTAGNYQNYTYDNIGQLKIAVGKESGGTTNRSQEQLAYGYDAAHNLIVRTNNALVQTFVVNSLNELSNAARSGTFTVTGTTMGGANGVTVNANAATLYTDHSFTEDGFSLTSGYNTFTAVATDSMGRSDTHAVTAYLPATNNYSYDLNGNLLSDGKRAFDYDDENQLVRVTMTNAWKSEFIYDGKMRMRICKEYAWNGVIYAVTNEIHYIYDGNLVIQERDGSNLPTTTYTRGIDISGTLQGTGGIGGLLARTDNATFHAGNPHAHACYHADGNGNVTMLLDNQQVVVAKYLYDPFGNIISQSGHLAEANSYRFSSKEWHRNSGLTYYLFRFYDPCIQRWLNRDPIQERGCLNMFCFIDNRSMNSYDVNGLAADADTDLSSCLNNALAVRNLAVLGSTGRAFGNDWAYHVVLLAADATCALFQIWPAVIVITIVEVVAIGHSIHEISNVEREAELTFFYACLRCGQKYGDLEHEWSEFFKDHRIPGTHIPGIPDNRPAPVGQ